MAGVRVHNWAMSPDGYVAGPESPRDGRRRRGGDDEWIARGEVGIGATVMGRNMFGPIRGPRGMESDQRLNGHWKPRMAWTLASAVERPLLDSIFGPD